MLSRRCKRDPRGTRPKNLRRRTARVGEKVNQIFSGTLVGIDRVV